MALTKAAIKKIANLAKVKEADLEAALKDEKEVDLAIDEKVTTYTEEEITTLKNNEYKNGKEKGVEIAVKEAKEEGGYEFQGKTVKGLIEAAQKKALADAKLTPDKQVTELQEKVTNLQNTVKDYETKLADSNTKLEQGSIRGDVFKFIPASFGDDSGIEQEDVFAMMGRAGYEFKRENNKTVALKDGKPVLDKVSNPESLENVVKGFITAKKLGGKDFKFEGRGDGDHKPAGKAGKISELKKQFADQNKSVLGEEFQKAVEAAKKDNPEFDMAN